MTTARIITGDCLEVMRGMADNSVDAVVTDPPYPGLVGGYCIRWDGVAKARRDRITIGTPWDTSLSWVVNAKRIARLGAMVSCTYHSVPEVAVAFREWRRVMLLTWYKRNSRPTGANVPRFTGEFVWCFAAKPGLQWDRFTTTVLDIPGLSGGCMGTERLQMRDGTSAHPTQKPLELMRELVLTVPAGGSILDPFCGSGSTGVACARTGRNFIGIEIDPTYAELARKRIREECGLLCEVTT